MGSRWNLVFGQEPIPADPPDLSTLSSRWWVSSSHNSDTGPHWEATFQHVMDPQTLDGHYIAGPQTGDDASPQSGKGVPFVLGQPAVCEQPEPCSKAAGLGQFPGKLGCPQIAFASRQSPPTTFRSAPGAPGRDKLVHNPLPGLPAASAGLGAGSVYREGLIGAAWSSLWIKRMYNCHEIKGTGRKRGSYFKSMHKSTYTITTTLNCGHVYSYYALLWLLEQTPLTPTRGANSYKFGLQSRQTMDGCTRGYSRSQSWTTFSDDREVTRSPR